MTDDALFDLTTSDAPPCPLCGLPRRWNAVRHTFAPYCAGNSCDSRERTCEVCGERFHPRIDGAGYKFCGPRCAYVAATRRRYRNPPAHCQWCGAPAPSTRRPNPDRYLCRDCTRPIEGVLYSLRTHHVPIDMMRRLVDDPTCPICGTSLLDNTVRRSDGRLRHGLSVDHDHACCPGKSSCGKCVRGLLCNSCNTLIGLARDDANVLRAAADYLDRWVEP